MWLDPVNVAYFAIAAGFGAVFGGVSQILVDLLRSWRSRRAVGKALLAEVRACCALAATHEHYLSDHLLKDWATQSLKRQFFSHFRTPLWDAGTRDVLRLPRPHLERLVAFHAYLGSIDGKLDAYLGEQDRLAMALAQNPAGIANDIRQAMQYIADSARQMCASVGKCKDVRSLNELPLEYPDTFYHPS